MDRSFIETLYQAHRQCPDCPSPERVAQFFEDLLATLFPDVRRLPFTSVKEFELHLQKLQLHLEQILYRNESTEGITAEAAATEFFQELPTLHQQLHQDAQAMYEGDPAANSIQEVIRTYPGFYAIGAYRIAHRLHRLGVPMVPRLITEHAHSKTGIDIHPGARIGEYFCIDHGTGVVIGETTLIGKHVKIYQGVTLGALSVTKDVSHIKRHPTIGDYVVIYAGATILGGDTDVGHHCVVGGNVWLTRSLPPQTKVYYQARMHNSNTGDIDTVIYREHA